MTKKLIPTITKEKKYEVLMPNEDKALLKGLYLLRSYSGYEDPVRNYITQFLDQLHVSYVNYNGNIIGFNHPGRPLFSAHMDMVNTEGYVLSPGEIAVDGFFTLDNKTNIRLYRDEEHKKQTSLGADDKNGIWTILTLLKNGHDINFAFCHSEEVGGTGSQQIISNTKFSEFIAACQYGIVIDRRNEWDIIGYDNKYCLALDDRLSAFAKDNGFKFTPATGSCSDADKFSRILECVNLSCGYYEAHTSREYTNLNELWNTYLFCKKMLESFQYKSISEKRMREFKNISTYTSSYSSYSSHSNTYPKYSWQKEKEESVEDSVQKKTSQKATQIAGAEHTLEDYDTSMNEIVAADYMDKAMKDGVVYVPDLEAYLIPLYAEEDIPKNTLPNDIIVTYDCPSCGKPVSILVDTLDALFTCWFDKAQDKAFGMCTHCHGAHGGSDFVDKLDFLINY